MKAKIRLLILLALLIGATQAAAYTMTDGSTFEVSTDLLASGYDTGLFLNSGDAFNIYFDLDGIYLSNSPNNTYNSYIYNPNIAILSLEGQIIGTDKSGTRFTISQSLTEYTADATGNLYIFGEYVSKVPAPATVFLMILGLTGMVLARRKRS